MDRRRSSGRGTPRKVVCGCKKLLANHPTISRCALLCTSKKEKNKDDDNTEQRTTKNSMALVRWRLFAPSVSTATPARQRHTLGMGFVGFNSIGWDRPTDRAIDRSHRER